jgi:superfamily II DNA or RNA helicase
MAFQKTWRAYQARLLECLDTYLDDKRLHLAAAPGSGKTILGLEVIRRLDHPTLVLTPTITIRDQWIERLVECFLPPGEGIPSWMSQDLRQPAPLTVTTYQALHALCVGDADVLHDHPTHEHDDDMRDLHDGTDDDNNSSVNRQRPFHFPEILEKAGFRVLVVDEAHHLRAEWWRTLTFAAQRLTDPTIVALTATPPYDVSSQEWRRYEALCGAVDAEVSVPELVQQGDLCPHQDYVYLSVPSEQDQEELAGFRAAVDLFVSRLKGTAGFTNALLTHPWLTLPAYYAAGDETDPLYLTSMLVYLNAVDAEIPRQLLEVLGIENKQIPALNLDWLEILLSRSLYADAASCGDAKDTFAALRHELKELGAIDRHRVKLHSLRHTSSLLTGSATKIKSIEKIVRLEHAELGVDLRCVILADYIREAEAGRSSGNEDQLVGVVPIFEALRRAGISGLRLGVLSGSVVIIPTESEPLVRDVAAGLAHGPADIVIMPLDRDPGYSTVRMRGDDNHGTVELMTAVFDRGGMTVLVGTKSLLGEGWDAPCINTLVLATFVGSYVLSNQMRGRAIRVSPGTPQKTANIWHLACVEPGPSGPGEDYEQLVRRCRGFVGISATRLAIESGVERLGLAHPPLRNEQVEGINAAMCARASDRDSLRQRWLEALAAAKSGELETGMKTPDSVSPRGFVLNSALGALLLQSGSAFLAFFLQTLHDPAAGSLLDVVMFGAAAAALFSLPWTALAGWRLLRHGTPEWSIRRIGRVVLDCLESQGSISRHFAQERRFHINSNRCADGSVFCWLGGGTGQEQAVFLRALGEALGPIENPRYLLVRKPVMRVFREDYFSVPDALAGNQKFAAEFAQKWSRVVGPVSLVHTRTPEGRRILLRARIHSLAAVSSRGLEPMSSWK